MKEVNFKLKQSDVLNNKFLTLIFCCIIFTLSSCNFTFPNKMFKTPKGYQFATLSDSIPEYKIIPGDKLEFYIFTNSGDKLIDPLLVTSSPSSLNSALIELNYEIDFSGNVNLPKLGATHLAGLTENEAVLYLQEAYKKYYIEPYIFLQVTNRRVLVFRGNEESEMVELKNKNMTILEAIGIAGGISPTGKSFKIKVAREYADTMQISLLDFSTIEGLQMANKKVHPNDIIYIEPTINTDFIKEITPVITAVSGIVVIYAYFVNLSKI